MFWTVFFLKKKRNKNIFWCYSSKLFFFHFHVRKKKYSYDLVFQWQKKVQISRICNMYVIWLIHRENTLSRINVDFSVCNNNIVIVIYKVVLLTSSVPVADFRIGPEGFLVHRPEWFVHIENVSSELQQFSNERRPAPHVRHQQNLGHLVLFLYRFYSKHQMYK